MDQRNHWPRHVLAPAAVTLLACASCNTRAPATAPNGASPPLATIAPSEPPPPNSVDRLLALRPELKKYWLDYRTREGDARRRDHFSNLAFQLDQTCFGPSWLPNARTRTLPADRATETEVLSFLGMPDAGSKDAGNAAYVYSYWRTDINSRWVVIVSVKGGLLDAIGWNEAPAEGYPEFKPYTKWSDVLGRG